MKRIFTLVLAAVLLLAVSPVLFGQRAEAASTPTPAPTPAPVEGSLLSAFLKTMDAGKGAHLTYSFHSDFMDSTSEFDTHVKNGCFMCLRTVKASGVSSPLSATLVKDGATYNLYPDEKKGTVVLASTPGAVTVDLLSMDTLYRSVSERAARKDYTVEQREVEGKTYTVEVYPARDYTVEAAYYFDKDGALVHVLEGPPAALPQMGDTFYTVEKIDDKVDETLFDISGYKITEEP